MKRLVCALTASKGVVSGSEASMVIGQVVEVSVCACRFRDTGDVICRELKRERTKEGAAIAQP
jgi:hypothetical protein